MTDEKPVKQTWTTPSLESLEMKATASGDNPDFDENFQSIGTPS